MFQVEVTGRKLPSIDDGKAKNRGLSRSNSFLQQLGFTTGNRQAAANQQLFGKQQLSKSNLQLSQTHESAQIPHYATNFR